MENIQKIYSPKLRDYQEEVVRETLSALDNFYRVLVQAPTGSGKSIMSKTIIRSFIEDDKSVLIIAPQKELIEQLRSTYSSLGDVNLISGKNHYSEAVQLNLGTLQTIYRRDVKTLPDLVVIDEAHYGFKGKMLKQIFKMFDGTKFFFMSATPFDGDGKLLQGFDEVINLYSTQDLINKGYLVDVEVFAPVVPNLRGIKVLSGDYVNSQLNDRFNQSEIIDDIVTKTSKFIGNKQTVVYGINISHAENLALSYREDGYTTAVVSSKTPTVERERIIEAFKAGDIQILTNVDILTTGIDIPQIECIVLARATKSQNLYKQIIGRGLRSSEDKTICTILDCGSVVKELGYPTNDIKFKPKKQRGRSLVACSECSSTNTTLKDVEVVEDTVYKIYSCKDCREVFKLEDDTQSTTCSDCGYISLEKARGSVIKYPDKFELTSACVNCGTETVYRTIQIVDKELQKIHKSINANAKALCAYLIDKSDYSDISFIVDECTRLSDAGAEISIDQHHTIDVDNLEAAIDKVILSKELTNEVIAIGIKEEDLSTYKLLLARGIAKELAWDMLEHNVSLTEIEEAGVLDVMVENDSYLKVIVKKLHDLTGVNVARDFRKIIENPNIDMRKLLLLLKEGLDQVPTSNTLTGKSKQMKRMISYFKVMEHYLPELSQGYDISTLGFSINAEYYTLERVA